jgi:acetolactate synthase-1/2/3 large subunit
MNCAQAIGRCLRQIGVRRVYGLIGTSVLELFDALYDEREAIRLVATRHEQVAASMADAEGRLTGFPGTAIVHAGPGFLNSLISVANAYKDCSPMVLISGGVRRRLRGLDSWLEVDQLAMIRPLVKASYVANSAETSVEAILAAYREAMSPPQGPTYVEIPEDVQRDGAAFDAEAIEVSRPEARPPAVEAVKAAGELLRTSSRPLIVAGGGINHEKGSSLLVEFARRHRIPVATTGNGRGAFPEDDELFLGRVGFGGGTIPADYALAHADVVLALGAGISDVTTYAHTNMPKGKIITVNMDERCEAKPPRCDLHLYCDALLFLKELVQLLSPSDYRASPGWLDELATQRALWRALLEQEALSSSKGYVNANKFFRRLDEKSPPDIIVSAGQGLHILYSYAYQRLRRPRSFLAATNLGAMGFAFPAALAAKLLYPDREVYAVLGDGEFMMTVQDLETAVREELGVKVLLVNDNAYGVLYARQRVQKAGRVHGTRYGNPDFVKLAEAFGVKAMRLDDDGAIDEGLSFFLEEEGPLVLELVVDPDRLPPTNLELNLRMSSV